MRASAVLLLLLAVASQTAAKPKNRFTRYPSWNIKMYPIWKDGDPRYKDSWKGGRVSFNVANDSPTLTGAKITFTIDLEFPHNQKMLPDGDVVWAEDCLVNGTKYHKSEPVYPMPNTDWEPVFPDGTPIKKDKKPAYVFVWKAWGQYWQVSDGPSSSLTISTDDVPLGSYTMDIVIYHYRSKEKFIPLGYAFTQFSITDQIPFAVSLDQVNDLMAGDMRFIQNRAIAFTITLHDPSEYLSDADITFNWDFGDESGALISRELTVTHTYVNSGSFKPQVVVQAVIPDKSCDPPSDMPTKAPAPPADQGTTVEAPALVSAVPLLVSTNSAGLNVNMVPSDMEEDNSEDEASAASSSSSFSSSSSQPAQESSTLVKTPSLVNRLLADREAENRLIADTKRMVALTGRAAVHVLAKRNADEKPSNDDCVIYRYGSFCTTIEVVEGIHKVEIVQMDNSVMAVPGKDTNVLDITITCQGSLPKEVCSVILDAECLRPIHAVCNMVEPSRECQLVLRHFFNNSGVYCINVSMANDVSLAVASAKFNVGMGSALSSSGTITTLLGVLVLVIAVGIVAYSYKRFKSYRTLKEDVIGSGGPQLGGVHSCSGASMFWSLLNRRGAVDNCPLLQDRPM
ncbi:premelanosome protein b [Brachyistius frenatus]|uniref:premelanosome protein b n=1 Tax=Brachyistius frenatus TaxID=100188 RepID=UPI0037E8B896